MLLIAAVIACGNDKKNIFHVDIVDNMSGGRDIEMVSLPGGTFSVGSALYPVQVIDTVTTDPMIIDTILNIERPVHFTQVSSFLISSTEIT